MNKKRTIVAAVVLSLVLVVGGILAFFTDSDEKTNVFTIGTNVDITLNENETWVLQESGDNQGKYTSTNAASMYPGSYVAKSPTVTCKTGKSDCYVFIKVTSPIVGGQEVLTYEANSGWVKVGNDDTSVEGQVTRVYAYASNVSGEDTLTTLSAGNTTSTAAFGNVTINNYFNEDATKGELIAGNSYDLKVEAFGIQTTGMTATDLSGTWANFAS